jgi:hypothetical protein
MTIDVSFLDASQHDHFLHAVGLECIDQLIELADLDPVDSIDMLFQFRFGFALVGHREYLEPHLAGVIRKDDRKSSIPGDHADSTVWYRHGHVHRVIHTC